MPDDYFTDEEARKDYNKDLNYDDPDKFLELRDDIKDAKDYANKWADDYSDLANNWEDIVKGQITTEISKYEEVLKRNNLTAEDLGLKYDNKFILGLLLDENGKPNPKFVAQKHGFSVVKPESITNHLLETTFGKVYSLGNKTGREDGYKKRVDHEEDPSISGSQRNAADKIEKPKTVITDDMNLDEMEKMVNASRKAVLLDQHGNEY